MSVRKQLPRRRIARLKRRPWLEWPAAKVNPGVFKALNRLFPSKEARDAQLQRDREHKRRDVA